MNHSIQSVFYNLRACQKLTDELNRVFPILLDTSCIIATNKNEILLNTIYNNDLGVGTMLALKGEQ